jgi:hypothetical protein
VDIHVQSRSSALLFKATYSLLLLVSCQSVVVDRDKQDTAGVEVPTPVEVKAPVPSGGQHDTKVPNSLTDSKPFVAVLKKQEPVPDALSTGVLEISNNCLVVKINNQPGKIYTAVLPNNYKFISNSSNEKFIRIGERAIRLGSETPIPGGVIFIETDKYIQEKIPLSCPSDLFGIGE